MTIKILVRKVLRWRKEVVRKTAGQRALEAGKIYQKPVRQKVR